MNILITDLINVFLPETLLFGFIILNLLLSLLFGRKLYKFSGRFALAAIIIPLISISFGISHFGYTVFGGAYISTVFTSFMKVLVLLGAFLTVILSQNIVKKIRYKAFEYYTLLLIASFAAMCLIDSNDFIPMFVSLETLSLSSVMLIGFYNKYKSKEAAVKYFVMSAVSTGILLLGVSYIYGLSEELNYSLISNTYFEQDTSVLYMISSILVICGLTSKINCVPFHMFSPDVYRGASYPVCAFVSTIPVIAGFSALLRIITNTMYECPVLQIIIEILAILTIFFGIFGAIRQVNFKRFMGCSTVAHCGFMLLSAGIFSAYGLTAFMFYITAYLFMNFGVWAGGITFVACTGSDELKDYSGIFYVRPYYASAFLICLMALAGLPPTSGFLAKLFLFISVMRQDGSGLVFLIPSVILLIFGIYCYANLNKTMFSKKVCAEIGAPQMNTKIVLYFCSVMTILIFIFADYISKLSILASFGI